MRKVRETYLFTVVTAAYNNGGTIHRVYDSLRIQTCRDFEWLVVDDGSKDKTREKVEYWAKEGEFPIRYMRQNNRGKHIALNRAVREARGKFILVLDGDDACVPNALECFKNHWEAIPQEERPRYTGVTALCRDQYGRLIGDRFPIDVFDSNTLELRYRYKVGGEKWGFNRVELLRRFPFPEESVCTYIPESIIWNKIAREYQTRFINEELRIYWVNKKSLVQGRGPEENASGGQLQHLTTLNFEMDWIRYAPFLFLVSAVHYSRFAFHAGTNIVEQYKSLNNRLARVLWGIALPMGFILYNCDLIVRNKRR